MQHASSRSCDRPSASRPAPTLTLNGSREWLAGLTAGQGVMAILVIGFVVVTFGFPRWMVGRFTPTPEGLLYDAMILVALYLYLVMYLGAFCRLHQAWRCLRSLLQTLDSLPFQAAISGCRNRSARRSAGSPAGRGSPRRRTPARWAAPRCAPPRKSPAD